MTIISKKQMSEEDIKLQYYYRRSYSTGCSRKNEDGREEIARLRIV